jgi:hypothetical protein
MTLTLQLDDAQAKRLGNGQLRRLLGFSTPMEVHTFLQEHGIFLNYSLADLEQDRMTSDKLSARQHNDASTAA